MNNGSVINLEGDVASAGIQGYSAYEVAVQNGFEGTEEDFINAFLTPTAYLQKKHVIDNLITNDSKKALSAKQGYVLNNKISNMEVELNEEITARTNSNNELQTQINSLGSGAPLKADSVAEMTDTDRVYVNISDGNWYYYDGESWEIGGVYQAAEDSDSVINLNSFSDKVFETIYNNDYNGNKSSISREYLPFNIKATDTFRIEITINSQSWQGNADCFNLRTAMTPTTTYIKESIYSFTKDTVPSSETIVKYFTATTAASYFYLYYFPQGSYDFNVTIKKLKSNLTSLKQNLTNLDVIATNNYKKITSLKFEGDIVAEANRLFQPFSFKKGKKYLLNVIFNQYIARARTTYYTLKTTLTENNNSVVDSLDEYNEHDLTKNITNFTGEKLIYEYVPTEDCNFVYMYLTLDNPYSYYNIDVDIYELKEEKLKTIPYYGKKIDLSNNYLNCDLYMSITVAGPTAVQGMAIFDGKLFQCQHKGTLNVYDFENKNGTPLASCNLGSYSNNNHANCINFSNKYYNENPIPLAYVVGGNSGEVMECDVENIGLTEDNGTYTLTSELIQKITLDQSGFENEGYVPYWGWPCWLVSPDNKYLYVHGAKYRTNGSMREYDDDNRYIITKFHYPDLSESEVTLTVDDVLEQFTTPYEIDVTQGGTIYNDKIYYSFGFGNPNYPARIGVWDLRNKSYVTMIELKDTPVATQEPEDLCVYNNKLYLMTGSKKLYELEF